MLNVLVVGGAGYIGGALTDQLVEAGHNVRVYDNLLFEERYLKPVDFVYGDARDTDALLPSVRWADCVVWLVGLVGDGACALYPELTEELNVESVRWIRDNFDRRLIFMSTCSVYGAQDGLLTEDSPVRPLSLYARTKVNCEEILAGTGALSFRLGTLHGLGDTYSRIRLDLVLNLLTIKACLYGVISVHGGRQYRPLLHVRDVARAIAANVNTDHAGIFNLHAENLTIDDLAGRIADMVPGAVVERADMNATDARSYRVDSGKAQAAFGFAPQLTVDDGIGEIRRIAEEGRIRDVTSARYSNTDFLRPMFNPQSSPIGGEYISPRWRAEATRREQH